MTSELIQRWAENQHSVWLFACGVIAGFAIGFQTMWAIATFRWLPRGYWVRRFGADLVMAQADDTKAVPAFKSRSHT